MSFLLDESADARLAPWLRSLGHDVSAIAADHPASLKDQDVLAIARRVNHILITDDRDFGELIFARSHLHSGVIYLRLGEYADLAIKQDRITDVLEHYSDALDQFVVVPPAYSRPHAAPMNRDYESIFAMTSSAARVAMPSPCGDGR